MLHDNDQLPKIGTSGMSFGVGRHHKLTFKRKVNKFLPAPYSKCTETIPLALQLFYDTYPKIDFSYSMHYCIDTCLQRFVYEKCGCFSPSLWHIRYVVLPGTSQIINASLCQATDSCTSNILSAFVEVFGNNYCADCNAECSYTDFPSHISSASLFLDYDIGKIKTWVENTGIPLTSTWNTTWQNDITLSYLSIDIVSESPRIEKFTQKPSIDWIGLVSSIGGHTGLWIGISFLSLLELAEMLFRLVRRRIYAIQHGFENKYNDAVVGVKL